MARWPKLEGLKKKMKQSRLQLITIMLVAFILSFGGCSMVAGNNTTESSIASKDVLNNTTWVCLSSNNIIKFYEDGDCEYNGGAATWKNIGNSVTVKYHTVLGTNENRTLEPICIADVDLYHIPGEHSFFIKKDDNYETNVEKIKKELISKASVVDIESEIRDANGNIDLIVEKYKDVPILICMDDISSGNLSVDNAGIDKYYLCGGHSYHIDLHFPSSDKLKLGTQLNTFSGYEICGYVGGEGQHVYVNGFIVDNLSLGRIIR